MNSSISKIRTERSVASHFTIYLSFLEFLVNFFSPPYSPRLSSLCLPQSLTSFFLPPSPSPTFPAPLSAYGSVYRLSNFNSTSRSHSVSTCNPFFRPNSLIVPCFQRGNMHTAVPEDRLLTPAPHALRILYARPLCARAARSRR